MVRLKSFKDIEKLAEGGKILARILDELESGAQVGTKTKELDLMARELLEQNGCRPSFLNYAPRGQEPYPAALCVSINEAVVHGLPGDRELRNGDVVGLDLGLVFEGKYYLDCARTVGVGKIDRAKQRLLEVTEEALARGIEHAVAGNTTGDIGWAVEEYVESRGFKVVKQLVGHGVGFGVHEEPQVPNFGEAGQGEKLVDGLVIAIEPMVTSGRAAVVTGQDGWTVNIKTGAVAAHEEHTVAITGAGPRILTLN